MEVSDRYLFSGEIYLLHKSGAPDLGKVPKESYVVLQGMISIPKHLFLVGQLPAFVLFYQSFSSSSRSFHPVTLTGYSSYPPCLKTPTDIKEVVANDKIFENEN